MAIEPTLTLYTALDLFTWYEDRSLKLSPKFQRRDVWKSAARAYLIDSLLRSYPVPPIHLRITQDEKTKKVNREIIDGQQRLRSVFEFMRDQFRLAHTPGESWSGKLFSELEDADRERLLFTEFHTYQYKGLDDEYALEIFARLNTYSVKMNAQELRNGKYFGQFKSGVYSLGLDYLEFWRKHRIFTEASIARMSEAELVSELLILEMDGLQDKKASIEEFYKNLDDHWDSEPTPWESRGIEKPNVWLSRKAAEDRFHTTMQTLDEAVGDSIRATAFKRTPLFYSLYAAVYHRLFGVPNFRYKTPLCALGENKARDLRSALVDLSEMLSDTDTDNMPNYQRVFVIASSRQTDNVQPRTRRLESIWNQAGLGKP